jgi:hypothetical protein
MQKMIWTPRESDLLPLVHSTMHLPIGRQHRELVIVADFIGECVTSNCFVCLLHLLRSYHSTRTESQSTRVFNSQDLVDGIPHHVYNGCISFSGIDQCRGFDSEEAHIYDSHVALVRGRV